MRPDLNTVTLAGGTTRRSTLSALALRISVSSIGFGTGAFGAVYPWAYWPLAATCAIAGVLGLLCRDSRTRGVLPPTFAAALAAIAGAIVLQLVPFPTGTVEKLSPNTTEVLAAFDLAFSAGLVTRHSLSIEPRLTATGFALFCAFAILLAGVSRALSVHGCRKTVGALTVFGVVLALIGIIQKPLFRGEIYGFWTTVMGGNPFGPFVNKNHFAGWMLMALPLTLGLLGDGLSNAMRGVKPNGRDRFLWLSSSDANRLILVAAAAMVMALALVLTMSRSGISALALLVVVTTIFFVYHQQSTTSRAAGLTYLLLLVVLIVWRVGPGAIVTHFSGADWGELNERRGAWADAWRVAQAFPVTGTGLNTYGVASLFYQKHDLLYHYAQAHNDYLQLAAEGGLLLAGPFAVCVLTFATAVRKRFREETSTTAYWLRAGAVTGLLAIALQETVEFSLQMPANAALFAVVCGIALHKAPGSVGRRKRGAPLQ